jgi:phosphatidylglycerol---prolipoprotein diacylglyceryl transferase
MVDIFRTLFTPPRHLILVLAALWLGLSLAEKRSSRHGIPQELLSNLVYYSLLGYVLGGRLLFVFEHFQVFVKSPLSIVSPNIALFDPFGALATSLLVALIYGQKQKLPLWPTLDAMTPFFAILAIGIHLSHLAAGSAFGSPTHLPWGITLWNATRHPTQIYELLASLLIFAFLWFGKPGSFPGSDFLRFSALTAGSRLIFEAFRGDSTLILNGIRFAQLAAWLVLLAALITSELLRTREKAKTG